MNKRGISGLLVSLIILLVVMTFIIISTSSQSKIFGDKLSIFSLNRDTINADVIKNKCELACFDLDSKTYCKKYNLVIDLETSDKGTCEELAKNEYKDFSISKCSEINC